MHCGIQAKTATYLLAISLALLVPPVDLISPMAALRGRASSACGAATIMRAQRGHLGTGLAAAASAARHILRRPRRAGPMLKLNNDNYRYHDDSDVKQ